MPIPTRNRVDPDMIPRLDQLAELAAQKKPLFDGTQWPPERGPEGDPLDPEEDDDPPEAAGRDADSLEPSETGERLGEPRPLPAILQPQEGG